MPVTVRKSRRKGGGFSIVEKGSGKVKGHSSSKQKAEGSARARNAALHGWSPPKKGGKK